LRGRRMPRALHLAGRRDMPRFFDIDDTLPVYDPPDVEGADRADGGSATQEEISR